MIGGGLALPKMKYFSFVMPVEPMYVQKADLFAICTAAIYNS
jgi:hypothetical protein